MNSPQSIGFLKQRFYFRKKKALLLVNQLLGGQMHGRFEALCAVSTCGVRKVRNLAAIEFVARN